MISIIAAIGKNRELGKDNQLLWNIPEDLKRFRELTSGHPIIMGRKTFDSIGRVLPNRTNIIITRNLDSKIDGAVVVRSLEEAIDKARLSEGRDEIFIIGGGQIFQQSIDLVDRLYLTIVDENYPEADVFFPDYSAFVNRIVDEKSTSENFNYVTLEK